MINYYWKLLTNLCVKKDFLILTLILFFFTLLFSISCKDDPLDIGTEIQPPEDKVSFRFFESDQVTSQNAEGVPVIANNPDYYLLGSINDKFGFTRADFLTQFYVPYADSSRSPYKSILNISLNLYYFRTYGDTDRFQVIKVYELSKTLPKDTVYADFDPSEYYNSEDIIGERGFFPDDTVVTISLPKSFGEKLLNADDSTIQIRDRFFNYFKGLYITTVPYTSGGVICYFLLDNYAAEINVVYKDTSDSTKEFTLVVDQYCQRLCHYTTDHTHAFFSSNLIDTLASDNLLYIESMGSLYPMLRFNQLPSLKDSVPLIVNLAELHIPIDTTSIEIKPIHRINSLVLQTKDDNSKFTPVKDYVLNPQYFEGVLNKEKSEFVFNITKYVQDYLDGKYSKPELYITPSKFIDGNTINRVLLRNYKSSISLKITYHKL